MPGVEMRWQVKRANALQQAQLIFLSECSLCYQNARMCSMAP